MTVNDVFKEVYIGYNYINPTVKDKYAKYYKMPHKDSIQYTNIISSRLVERATSNEIKPKYFIQPHDIVVFVKKPFKVGTYRSSEPEDIVITNNFVILRGIDETKYHYLFVAYYLDKIGINKFVKECGREGNLSLDDIKQIELPNISLDKQLSIASLLSAINSRSNIYNNILDNDEMIIDYALESVLGDKND